MGKIQVLDINGKKTKEITTNLFEEPIREDIIRKVVEAERIKHPNSPKYRAGMDISASGNLSKRRHVWKSDRGKGLARLPRKIFSRRGTQFNWEAAIVPSARGGRRAHPPHGNVNLNKVNKRELKMALMSSLNYVTSSDELKKKYSSLSEKEINVKFPLVVEDKVLSLKSKEFLSSLKKILGNLDNVAIQKKTIRAGIGKLRGRKNKKNAGLLLIIGNKEEFKVKGIEVLRVKGLTVSDLASNGARLCMFSENAIKDLERIMGEGK
jgi:large subunit ribosomal protein L4e